LTKVDKEYFAVPGLTVVFVLCAVGNSLEEVKSKLESAVDKVDADGLNKDVNLDGIFEELSKVKDYGLTI